MVNLPLRLYELVLENGRGSSPYVWRIRYALAHKGLPVELVPVGFTEISGLLGGRYTTVPILTDDATEVGDSWDIAHYLDRAFPERPALFSGPGEVAALRLCDEWQASALMRKLFAMYALDIHDAARPADRPYFRRSRELKLKGKTLEQFVADRESTRRDARIAMAPWRAQLARSPFLGGESPGYADYLALGAFHWVASVATLPLLAANDPLVPWLDRCFDLYDGLGRDPRMRPLIDAVAS